MYLHEFQAKELLKEFGIPIRPFLVVESVEAVEQAVNNGLQEAVVKVQVHAGGRAKAGGVVVARSGPDVIAASKKLLGMRIINNQTGPEGLVSEKLLLDTVVRYTSEYYLGITVDRKTAQVAVLYSKEGGTEIEQAHKAPGMEFVPASGKLRLFQLQRLAKNMGWQGVHKEAGIALVQNLLKAFFAFDALLLEINPLVATDEGFVALDVKMNVDDNALYRQKRVEAMWDPSQETKSERLAHQHELQYVALDGNIGCVVNGAGLAMATMDLIRFWGGSPANFLDVGGGATLEKVVEGFKILNGDPKVKAIFVNIFGGIMNCEIIAQALIEARCKVPVVIRMEGTNVDSAKKMLEGMDVVVKEHLDEAAQAVCGREIGNTGT